MYCMWTQKRRSPWKQKSSAVTGIPLSSTVARHAFCLRKCCLGVPFVSSPIPCLWLPLWESGFCHLTLAGGDLYREPGIVYSSSSTEPDFYASKFFLGAQGLGATGIVESHPLMLKVIDGLARKADEIVVLADSSKFDVRARYPVLPIERISTLITDDGISEADHDMMRNEGVDVIIAATPQTEQA